MPVLVDRDTGAQTCARCPVSKQREFESRRQVDPGSRELALVGRPMNPHRPRQWRLEKARLLAAIGAACAIGAATEPVTAKTWLVNSCGERVAKGITTLRYACTHAVSGDVVDLSALSCSTITLTAGEIPISVMDLTIQAAAGNVITIDAAQASRIFTHTTSGTLDLRYLTLVNGVAAITAYTNSAAGGCVYNRGPLFLRNSTVSGCSATDGGCVEATSGSVTALGTTFSLCQANWGASAIYAATSIALTDSTVAYNHFTNAASSGATIQSLGSVSISHSTISNNLSASSGSGISAVGALIADHMTVTNNSQVNPSCLVYTRGTPVSITYSSIENNTTATGSIFGQAVCIGFGTSVADATISATTIADNSGAAVSVYSGSTLTLVDSTIANNGRGGLGADHANINVRNSTIAHNFAGILIGDGAIDLQSSIIAKNGIDLSGSGSPAITGANNLIVNANVALPAGTLQANPRLTTLAFHGGPTRTFGLSLTSPAINAGNNTAGAPNDQRGTGYVRVVGATADIGAYERQTSDDELFYGGFD